MHSFTEVEFTDQFDDAYSDLESDQQKQCDKAIRFLLNDPSHRSLRYKPIKPAKVYYEASINMKDRLIVRPAENTAKLIDVVDHDHISQYGHL